MQWLNKIVDELTMRHPDGEILIESGASPSGTYHFGHLRELVTSDAILLELKHRGREAKHIHFVDDLDALRKVPINIPTDYDRYLGKPLCDIPAPDGSDKSFGDYFLDGFLNGIRALGIEVEVIYSHQKYRSGFFVPAIEHALGHIQEARSALETVSGRQLDEHWSPIQVMEDGRLKNRRFISIDTSNKTVQYEDSDGQAQTVQYDNGEVKMDWRLDWPGRWWLMHIQAEPFGRDHATKGGSYDTGVQIMKDVYGAEPPLPIPYDFINRAGDTKKMSASKGTGIDAAETVKVLPAEVVRFFMLRYPPDKRLYFDQGEGVIKLIDEFAELVAKPDKTDSEEQLLYLCTRGISQTTVSRVPFSHLVASYQAALCDPQKTLEVIRRTEHAQTVDEDEEIIKNELAFITEWLDKWASEDVKFTLRQDAGDIVSMLSDAQKTYLSQLAKKIEQAPADADGEWFHKAIYDFKDTTGLSPKDLFTTLYQVLIGKNSGPRAGWFLSLLPRDWLIKRLKLEA